MKKVHQANRIIFYTTLSLLLLGFPLAFSFLEIPSNTEKLIITTVGSALVVCSVAGVLLDLYVLYFKTSSIYKLLSALRGTNTWLPLLTGLFVFFALFTNKAPTIGLIVGISTWLTIFLFSTILTK